MIFDSFSLCTCYRLCAQDSKNNFSASSIFQRRTEEKSHDEPGRIEKKIRCSRKIRRDYREREIERGWQTWLVEGGESFVIVLSISLSLPLVRLAPEINVLYGGRTPSSARSSPKIKRLGVSRASFLSLFSFTVNNNRQPCE